MSLKKKDWKNLIIKKIISIIYFLVMVCICLSVYLASVYPSSAFLSTCLYLSIFRLYRLFVCLSIICLFVSLSIIRLYVYLFVYFYLSVDHVYLSSISACPSIIRLWSVWLFVCIYLCLFIVYLSISIFHLSVSISIIFLSVYPPSVHLPLCFYLSIRLSIYI